MVNRCCEFTAEEPSMLLRGRFGGFYTPFHTTKESRNERQPFCSRTGHVILWDGRLDNRDELLPLVSKEIADDQSDVAIVSAAFERWGEDCLGRLHGDWALVLWEPQTRTFNLAVDYLGIRHIYFVLHETY